MLEEMTHFVSITGSVSADKQDQLNFAYGDVTGQVKTALLMCKPNQTLSKYQVFS